jgi:hypothetical protein
MYSSQKQVEGVSEGGAEGDIGANRVEINVPQPITT